MKFFFDNNISPRLSKAINELDRDNEIYHLQDKFEKNVSDIYWINKLSEDGDCIIISGDYTILKNRHEKQAWEESGLTGYFLKKGWQKIKLWDIAWRIIKIWPDIVKHAEQNKGGNAFSIPIRSLKFEELQAC